MLHNHLRTLSDYVYAIGIDLYIEPINHYETHFLNTLADVIKVRRKIKDHPHIKVSADVFHMAMEEQNSVQALRDYAADIGYIHLADSNRRLPGQGMIDFAAIATVLKETNYDGWIGLAVGNPGHNAEYARDIMGALPAALDHLRKAGFEI